MMNIMMLSPRPEGQEVMQAPRKIVTAMRVDRLEQTQHNPDIHCQYMQVPGDRAPDDGAEHRSEAQQHDLNWRRVFGCHPEGSAVLVVDLMDVLIQRTPMQRTMAPIVPRILDDEENRNLVRHREQAREGYTRAQPEILRHGVEEPDLWQLDGEMAQ